MRIHHLVCGTMCPAKFLGTGKMVCHCLLCETKDGLALVDTGIGLADMADPTGRLGRMFVSLTRPVLDETQTAVRQVAKLGFSADDVRHLVVTHLDLDHAGGLPDFPKAKVHVLDLEHAAAMARKTWHEKNRYIPAQWAHGPDWALHTRGGGERWFGFESVRAVGGTDDEILLVPLLGHTRGHCAVAVRSNGGWILHAGDAYFHHGEVDLERPHCPWSLAQFQKIVQVDGPQRVANQARLRDLRREHGSEVRVICAHDPEYLA